MFTLIAIVLFILAILLGGVVLIQSSKGGGLAGSLSGGNQYMGVQKTTEGLEKVTWGFAAAVMFFSIVAAFAIPSHKVNTGTSTSAPVKESKLKDNVSSMPQQIAPGAPAPGAGQASTTNQPAK